MRQYTLPLALPTHYSEDNFFVSDCNRLAYEQITRWPNEQQLLLSGPPGSGKTHLGYIWAGHSNAGIIRCSQEQLIPEQLQGPCLIETIEAADEKKLLHCINLAKEKSFSLLLTASSPAKQLAFTLPDLTSRLCAMSAAHIDTPDDEALKGVMRKQFADRQIGISEDILQYLLTHTERSFAAINDTVARLDAAMWQEKKNLTIPFIRKTLAQEPAGTAS